MLATLDEEHINMVLKTQQIGRLGCAADGQPYVVPITYVYHDGYIFGHTNEGQKIRMLRQNPKVCLEVDEIDDMANWRSVVVLGVFEELRDEEAARAIDLIIDRLSATTVSESIATPVDPTTATVDTLSHAIRLRPTKGITYRIRLTEKSGRYERH